MKKVYPVPSKTRARPTTNLGEVLQTKAVAILSEIGYHDNEEDVAWLKNNLTPIARNLVQSLTEYFGIPFIEPTPVKNGIVRTDGSNLNLRSYPSTKGAIIGFLPNGARVKVYGETGGWYVVVYNDLTGYASSEFIDII
jgi:N-acetylmuramoyl-L-alanine amidase